MPHFRIFVVYAWLPALLLADPISLRVSSDSGSAGSTVSISIHLASPSGGRPAAVQWDLILSPLAAGVQTSAGEAANSAGKSIQCQANRCIAYGLNANPIPDGVLASVHVTLPANASGNIAVQLANVAAASVDGNSLPTMAGAGAISVWAPVSIAISPAGATLSAGQSQQFTTQVTGGPGNQAVNWSVNPALGTISSSGLYTAPAVVSAQQTVTVTATSAADPGKSASAAVTLTRTVSVWVSPLMATLSAGQKQQFFAWVMGPFGQTAVNWTISPAVGTVSSSGLYTAPAAISAQQTVTVTATSAADPGKSASAAVTLLAQLSVGINPSAATLSAGQSQQFTAQATGGAGKAAVNWSIAPAVGTVSSSGLYTAPVAISAQQTVTVTATSAADPSKSASAVVTLLAPVSVGISPAGATLSGGQSQQFTAQVMGGSGNTAVNWAISPTVGAISGSGLYTAPVWVGTPQTVTVRATSAADPNKSASAVVTLLAPVSVSISPAGATLSAGQSQQFTVQVTGGAGNTAVNWSITPAVGAISSSGLYTAPGAISVRQTVTVTASSADPNKSASVEVTLLAPVSVSISPATTTVSAGQSQQFTAQVTGGLASTAVNWGISPTVGTISNSGLYTAPGAVSARQTVTVTATSAADPNKSASAVVTLLEPVSVSISPAGATVSAGQSQQFTAQVVGGPGNTAVSWSANPAVGTISSSGLYTAPVWVGTPQTVTVRATSVADPGKWASAVVTLTRTGSVWVSPLTAALSAGQKQQFFAWVMGPFGQTAVNWTISPAVGTISSEGLYTAPAVISTRQTVTIGVACVSDPTQAATATVTLAVSSILRVTPAAASLNASQTQQFAALGADGAGAVPARWMLSPMVGVIDSAGLYTAPSILSSRQTVTITAVSLYDGGNTGSATVTLFPAVGIWVTPNWITLLLGRSQQFTAYVFGGSGDTRATWTISPNLGDITSTGTYTAPASAADGQAVTVTATSVADPRQSANAYIKLTTGTSTVTSLGPLQSHRFSLADSRAAQSGWVVDPPLGMMTADGLYIAPAAIDAARDVSVGLSEGASQTGAGIVTLLRAGISPAEADLAPGEAVHFAASFAGLPPEARWAIEPSLGTISPVTGLYIAPAKIPEPRSVKVTATSVVDPSQISIARIQLWPWLAVEDSPAEPALRYQAAARLRSGGTDRPSLRVEPESATLEPGRPVPFRLVDSGGNALNARWRVVPPLGSISASGEYRAPEGLISASVIAVMAEPISVPGRQAAAAARLMAAVPELLRFSCSRSSSQAVCQVTLSVAATAHGADIAIGAAPGDAVIAPSSWHVPGGSKSGTFPVTVLAPGARLTATLGTTLEAEIPE